VLTAAGQPQQVLALILSETAGLAGWEITHPEFNRDPAKINPTPDHHLGHASHPACRQNDHR
jgi:hypothetical protein